MVANVDPHTAIVFEKIKHGSKEHQDWLLGELSEAMRSAAKMVPVEYRNPSDMPTINGWYYARYNGLTDIKPVHLIDGVVWATADSVPAAPDRFTWFGPVMEVREG